MKKILYIVMLSVILISCGKDNAIDIATPTTDLESNVSDEESLGVADSKGGNSQFSVDSGLDFNQ